MKKRFPLLALVALSLLLVLRPAAASEPPPAEDLTQHCSYSRTGQAYTLCLNDPLPHSAAQLKAGETVTISWKPEIPVKSVFIALKTQLSAYTILQYDAQGTLLSEEMGPALWNHAVSVEEGACRVSVRAEETPLSVCSLYAYGEGTVPNVLAWAPTVDKADYMIIAMHPDDDVLFLGAIIPVYGVQQGRSGTAVYLASRNRQRVDEALQGAWTMGLRTLPLFGNFADIPNQHDRKDEMFFRQEDVTLYLVRQFRQLRPEVVITQDLEGEYGHWQHKLMARSVLLAAPLAADPNYDPQSAAQFGLWDVKKVYLHLYPENRITLPVTEPLPAFGGKTATDIAKEAFQCHASQQNSRHAVTNEGVYDLAAFGLAYTTVGHDTPGRNDMFENISPAVLSPQQTARSQAFPPPGQ